MINSLLIGPLNAICPSRRANARRSLAVVIFVCVELLSFFGAEPKSSTESESSEYTNHLINEKSPYLLQHAHNPVDWYPWGEEAFATARKESKPIFLSVGYSTCHSCHVMERESYSDPEIAKILNANFVSVKGIAKNVLTSTIST
jgi:hypothetical protein